MELRINIEQGETLELTDIYTKEIVKFQCQKCIPMNCAGCAFMFKSDICNIINCNGNYRKDKSFVHFVKVE